MHEVLLVVVSLDKELARLCINNIDVAALGNVSVSVSLALCCNASISKAVVHEVLLAVVALGSVLARLCINT